MEARQQSSLGRLRLASAEDFARLLEEEVQARVLEKTAITQLTLPPELERHMEPLRSTIAARSRQMAADEMPRAAMAAAMPPCMVNLLSLLQSSKHISHMGRFAMAAFLLNIGTSEEELLEMFKSFTDFEERIANTKWSILAGKHGSRRKYTAPNCSTMRTHGYVSTQMKSAPQSPIPCPTTGKRRELFSRDEDKVHT